MPLDDQGRIRLYRLMYCAERWEAQLKLQQARGTDLTIAGASHTLELALQAANKLAAATRCAAC